jgi:radical SAM superfamily enzyme with C-terminal helix-hairpin-helix motif
MSYSIILDCYTDEPSGYGVRPYLGTHQIHLSQALAFQGVPHYLLTIDDLRYATGKLAITEDIAVYNVTKNRDRTLELLSGADRIFVIMGCFVDYQYFSCVPPKSDEVAALLKSLEIDRAEIILFYVMGTLDGISPDYADSNLAKLVTIVEHGNTYRFVLEGKPSSSSQNLINPDYESLSKISAVEPPIIGQLDSMVIAEIETGTGCNTPTCVFCIESVRSPKVRYREPKDIASQIRTLYSQGVRHFRLGRQPNFYHYYFQNIEKLEELLSSIRGDCPDIRMLHIDNANIVNVATKSGKEFTKLIAEYCTPGNIAPFGIESFDERVRKATGVVGTSETVMKAIDVINEFGSERGNNGLPKFLPGINIIYGLPGQSIETHKINMQYLRRIIDAGYMTQRLYFRQITQPTGVSFAESFATNEDFANCFDEIVTEFVLPMQERVYPKDQVIFGDIESVRIDHQLLQSRFLATCSIKMVESMPSTWVPQQRDVSYRIKRSLGYRELEVERLS